MIDEYEDNPQLVLDDIEFIRDTTENLIQELKSSNVSNQKISAFDDAETYFNLGVQFANQNCANEAEDAWRKAISFNPQHVLANYNLGLLFASQNRLNEAEKKFSKSNSI